MFASAVCSSGKEKENLICCIALMRLNLVGGRTVDIITVVVLRECEIARIAKSDYVRGVITSKTLHVITY